MNKKPEFIAATSSLVTAVGLFFPVLIAKQDSSNTVVSFWHFAAAHPLGFSVPFLYALAAFLILISKDRLRVPAGILHAMGLSIFTYLLFAFSNTDADIPSRFIPATVAVFILPLGTIFLYLLRRSKPSNEVRQIGISAEVPTWEYSAVNIANALAEALKAINVAPLVSENLVFQKDALSRLDEEEEQGPFATFEYSRIENDDAFTFAVMLFQQGFMLKVDDLEVFTYPYALFEEQQDVVNQLILLLKVLFNGQFSLLLSLHSGYLFAFEILLYKRNRLDATVIETDAHFPLLAVRHPVVEIRRNVLVDGFYTIPDTFFLHRLQPDGYFPTSGRLLEPNQPLTPLGRKEWTAFQTDKIWTGTGKSRGESPWWLIYAQWEFWVLAVLLYGSLGFVWWLGIIKDPSFFEHPALYILPITLLIFYAMPKIVRKKENRKAQQGRG